MALIDGIKKSSNMIDNRNKFIMGGMNPSDYDEVFRFLCKEIANISITSAKKEYGKVPDLKSIVLFCNDQQLGFEMDPVVEKFMITHQEKGKNPIDWVKDDIDVTEVVNVNDVTDPDEENTDDDSEVTVIENRQNMIDENHGKDIPGAQDNVENNQEIVDAKSEEPKSETINNGFSTHYSYPLGDDDDDEDLF